MMSVADALKMLDRAESIVLFLGDDSVALDKDNAFMVNAFGRYEVEHIRNHFNRDEFELHIAVQPKVTITSP